MTGGLSTVLAGAAIGLTVAVPIGPMGVLCIQRTIASGPGAGLATGLGAATVHLTFAALAGLGLGTLMSVVSAGDARPLLSVLSSAVLFWFAFALLRRSARPRPHVVEKQAWWRAYASACLFGLSNPVTVVLFAAAFPALSGEAVSIPLLAGGVFLGSVSWWTVLVATIAVLRGCLSARALMMADRVSGLALGCLGLTSLAQAFGLNLRDVTSGLVVACTLRVEKSVSSLSLLDLLGFAAAFSTLVAFAQQRMIAMRIAAIAANLFFISYGALGGFFPVLILHLVLLPLNVARFMAGRRWPSSDGDTLLPPERSSAGLMEWV